MSERVAIVAGAGPLGQAVATRLAAGGFTVVGVDRKPEGLAALPEGVRRERSDVTDPAVAKPLIDRVAAEVGPPEVLVDTIGTFALGDAMSATPEDLRRLMDVNVGAALWLTQAVVPHMLQRGAGSIVFVSARPALVATPGTAAYSLSKAALSNLVGVLDAELHPQGIRVNAAAPQLIDTPLNRSFLPPEALEHAITIDALADLLVFLASDASSTVSGAIVPAYGG